MPDAADDMPETQTLTVPRRALFPRAALWLAAALALAAVIVAITRARQGERAPAAIAAQQSAGQSAAPSVDQAIATLETRLAKNPQDAEGWRMLGWAYYQTERYGEAATALKRATALDPRNASYQSFLGETLVLGSADGSGMPADARAAFGRALALDPKDARARYFHAVARDLDGDHRGAIEEWFALLAETPADAPWAQDVRDVIASAGKKNGVPVDARLAAARQPAAAAGFVTDGGAKAAAAIPGPSRSQIDAARSMPPGAQDAMIRGMVDRLAARLAKQPGDADGWIMLMRSRMQLGEAAAAALALRDGLAALRNDGAASRKLREAAATLGISPG